MNAHQKYYGKTMEEMLALTEAAVEADSYSSHMLWFENRCREAKHVRTWDQITFGWSPCIAEVDFNGEKYPIVVSLFWTVVSDKLVLFYHCCSMVKHVDMVDKWIRKMCPNMKHMNDAMNFHNCFRD